MHVETMLDWVSLEHVPESAKLLKDPVESLMTSSTVIHKEKLVVINRVVWL